jgi:hypothetical protein
MDIDDNQYYKKYIKYKTKYLELKHSEGGGFGIGKKSNYGLENGNIGQKYKDIRNIKKDKN